MSARNLAFLAVAAVLSAVASADNAALTAGGRPTMLAGHPSVSMESEVVKLIVHWNRVETVAKFVFVNHGPPCAVDMGFPDFGLWAYEYVRSEPHTMFKSFRSFVDGKPVKTRLVLDKDRRRQWQTKIVPFGANSRRVVTELYTTEIGGVAAEDGLWAFACYLLHTGASWKGDIGRATVTVAFDPDSEVKTPLDAMAAAGKNDDAKAIGAQLRKPGGLCISGPCKPRIDGKSVVFEFTKRRPTESDDIYIAFAFPRRLLEFERSKAKAIPRSIK